ncbi:MAG: hypothetical protein ACMG51_10460 [Ginsengibacter sp.]
MLPAEYDNPGDERILLIGLHTAGSGLTGVGMSLAKTLAQNRVVGYAGIELRDRHQSCNVLPPLKFTRTLSARGPRFAVNQAELDATIESFHPTLILVIGSLYPVRPLLQQLQPQRLARRLALYVAIEAELTDTNALGVFYDCDLILTYSDFARDSVRKLSGQSRQAAVLPPIVAVGHGITERRQFFPIKEPSKQAGEINAMRSAIFGRLTNFRTSSFVILNANRAYYRKRLDISVAGFSEFLQRTDADAYLYLHALFLAESEREAIVAQCTKLGVANRVYVIPRAESYNPRSLSDLNLLYNAADVGLNTAMGEGFGLVSFEHALAGRPQVVPDHTGLHETWYGAAEMVPATQRQPVFYEYGDMFKVSASGVAEALLPLYCDRDYRSRAGMAASTRARDDAFSWNKVSDRIIDAMDRCEIEDRLPFRKPAYPLPTT